MPDLPPHRRILILTEGQLGVYTSKSAACLLRYRASDVVGIVDSVAVGLDLTAPIPWAPPVPILSNVEAAEHLRPDALYVGVAPVGGALPLAMRAHVLAALHGGLDVVSGLHEFLADDPELAAAAVAGGGRVYDLRRPPATRTVAAARTLTTRCRRVLTVGTDCNVGKMVAAVELANAARKHGLDARFVATGQTGIMVAGRGVAIDACVADFAAGAIEQQVLGVADADLCIVEGQGSLGHPGFSGVTLALLHGACPDVLVLVHQLGRTHYKAPPHSPLPPLDELRGAYEQVTALLHPARVVAVALNTLGVVDSEAARAAVEIEVRLGVPVADPIRNGCDRLLSAILDRRP